MSGNFLSSSDFAELQIINIGSSPLELLYTSNNCWVICGDSVGLAAACAQANLNADAAIKVVINSGSVFALKNVMAQASVNQGPAGGANDGVGSGNHTGNAAENAASNNSANPDNITSNGYN